MSAPENRDGSLASGERERHSLHGERLWPKIWHMACRLDQVANQRDFVEYRIADHSVFVIRAESGLNAFVNRCTHRKARIVEGEGYCLKDYLTCPLHGWRWDLDGKIKYVSRQYLVNDRDRPVESLHLMPCRLEVQGGWVFINLDDEASPLATAAGVRADGVFPKGEMPSEVLHEASVELMMSWDLAIQALASRLDRTMCPAGDLSTALRDLHGAVVPAGQLPTGQDDARKDAALCAAIAPLEKLLPARWGSQSMVRMILPNFIGLDDGGIRLSLRVCAQGEGRCHAEVRLAHSRPPVPA